MTDEQANSEEQTTDIAGGPYLKKLMRENRAKFEEIKSYGAGLEPVSVLMMRLDTFLDMALSPEDRVKFETRFEQAMSEALENTLKQVRQQSLLQGVPPGGVPLLGPDGMPVE